MTINETTSIWMNGKLIPWEQATTHVMSHALHYGSSVFEGIRCYETPQGPGIFRLTPHMQRLYDSAKIYRMEIPYSCDDLIAAAKEVIRHNGISTAYIRPIAYRGYGTLGLNPSDSPVDVVIGAIAWGSYLGVESLEHGVDVGVSSWSRFAPNTMPALAKAGGNYLNSMLIQMESARHGYQEGIALDASGLVSEGSGENLFLVQQGVVYTPPLTSSILGGITRDSVLTLCADLDIPVREQTLPRELLYVAEEVFFSGTAAEIVPIRSVDGITVGAGTRGPVTAQIQAAFFDTINGERPDRHGWLEHV